MFRVEEQWTHGAMCVIYLFKQLLKRPCVVSATWQPEPPSCHLGQRVRWADPTACIFFGPYSFFLFELVLCRQCIEYKYNNIIMRNDWVSNDGY